MRQLAVISFMLLTACSDDDGGKPPVDAKDIDASLVDAPLPDAPVDAAVTVVEVTCPTDTTGIETVTAPGSFFMPDAVTVAQDGVVRFMMPSSHNVVPDNSLPTDPGLRVDFNATTCLRFTALGTFNFKCQPHGFKGHVTVE